MKSLAFVVAVTAVATAAAANLTREQAARFLDKVHVIVAHAETQARTTRETVVTENEVNSYLRFSAGDQLPVGVTEPSIGIEGRGRLNGRAIVDLDQVRQKKSSGGWFDPLSYLTGRLPVTAVGTLETSSGRGRFLLESAAVSGIPIPKPVLQEIVSFYTRTPESPSGINIDDPFDLPAAIKRIDVNTRSATIVQ